MRTAEFLEINDQLTLLEFAVQDLTETELIESAEEALLQAQELSEILDRYVRKEKGNGNRIQSGRPDGQLGQRPTGERRRQRPSASELHVGCGPRPV